SGITFLLVMNRKQLEESVKCRYGNGIDSVTYLQKFINVWLSLPRVSSKSNQDDGVKYLKKAFNSMSEGEGVNNVEVIQILQSIVRHLKPSLRDIERILTYFAIIDNSSDDSMSDFYQNIMATVCFLKAVNPRLLDEVVSKRASTQELLDFLQISKGSNYLADDTIKHLAAVVEFDLASEESRALMQRTRTIEFRFGIPPSQVFNYFYQLLNNIQPAR
ncbi:P-loop NTPase fold protein, partial [Aeromonas hydrophila]